MATKKVLAALAVVCIASRQWLTTLGAIGLALAVATPTLAQGNGGGKKGGGGKKIETVYARQVSIDDAASGQLKSDGKVRLASGDLCDPADPAADEECKEAAGAAVIYQDHRIVLQDSAGNIVGPYSDRCVGVGGNDKQFKFDRGAEPYETNCNVAFPGDGRTLTIVFKPANPADPHYQDPVFDVCNQFRFLIETSPQDYWGPSVSPSEWGTRFAWNDPGTGEAPIPDEAQGCSVTLATGGIVTDSGHAFTASLQFWADPWETQKIKGQVVELTEHNLNINFRVDRPYPGAPGNWQVKSQQWDLDLSIDKTNNDVRTISADQQLFDLCLGSGCVAFGFTLPLQIRYERIKVPQ